MGSSHKQTNKKQEIVETLITFELSENYTTPTWSDNIGVRHDRLYDPPPLISPCLLYH